MTEFDEDSDLTPEEVQLDQDLINEANRLDDDTEEDRDEDEELRNPLFYKAVGLLTVVVFLALILADWMRLISIPPLDFLVRSGELAEDPKIREVQQAVVMVRTAIGQGTGFNIDPQGLIVTNKHVVDSAKRVTVTFASGVTYKAASVVRSPDMDLAVIRIEGDNLPSLRLDTTPLNKGDPLKVIGDPLGLNRIVVEATVLGSIQVKGMSKPVLMLNGPVEPGNSGSPVFNAKEGVVAVVFASMKQPVKKTSDIVGLAIPVQYLVDYLKTQNIKYE